MNEFWDHATGRDLRDLGQPELPYPGVRGIRGRFRKKIRPRRRRLLRAAVAAAVVAALSLGVWAGYERWHMPERGEPFTGENIQVHGENTYTLDPGSGSYQAEPTQEDGALPDSWFLAQAVAAMEQVNKADVDKSRLTVTRQSNQSWGREEVVVSFPEDGQWRDVTFDAESGYLIGVTAFDAGRSGGEPMSDGEALAAAQGYYDALPYARGYEFRDVEKFDDESWMYCFDRPIQVELWGAPQTLYSVYEEVRIIIDPRTGAFQDSNCFYGTSDLIRTTIQVPGMV